MGIKEKLCAVVKTIKEDDGLTYDEILEKCNAGSIKLSRSQLSNVLCKSGKNVSIELIDQIIDKLGSNISINSTKKEDAFY